LFFSHFNKISCACLLLCSLALWSSENDIAAELDFFGDVPLVLTASRMSKPLLEAPATVSIIDRKTIESSGVREIADLFLLVPGFVVGHSNDGNTKVVSYQGLGGPFTRQIQVQVDGRSVLIPSFGGVSWSNLPLLIEDIERIEVIRGPNAVTYGTNAFLATINIITRHAVEDYGTRYSVTTSDNASANIKSGYVRHGYHHGDLDWRLSLGINNDDGFREAYDSKQVYKINFRLDQASQDNQFWTVQLGRSGNTSEVGSVKNTIDIEREFEVEHTYFNLLWEGIGDTSSTIVQLSHTQQEFTDRFDPSPATLNNVPGFSFVIDQTRHSDRSNLEITHTKELDPSLRFVYGAGLLHDRVSSIALLKGNETHSVDTSRLFASLEWRLNNNWLLDIGTSIENSTLSDTEASPRFSIIREFSNSHALRFVASSAKRNPVLYEHSALTLVSATHPGIIGPFDIKLVEGNPDIKSESIDSYEIGLRSQLITSGISSDIKLFTYKITDQVLEVIIQENNPTLGPLPVTTYNNQGETRVQGIELSLDFSVNTNLEFKTGVSAIDVESNDLRVLASFIEKTGFIHALYHWEDRHNLSASYYYLDEVTWYAIGTPRPSYEKLDLRYTYLVSGTNDTRIELIGQNLLGDHTDDRVENIAEKTIFLRFSSGF
jgi:iron complex outermembrane receptor protein